MGSGSPQHIVDLSWRERLVFILLAAALLCALAVRWAVQTDWFRPPPRIVRQDVDIDYRIDLNSATSDELSWLPGIGPRRAEAIVAYREEHGAFGNPDDLTRVRNIGPGLVDMIRRFVVARPTAVGGSTKSQAPSSKQNPNLNDQ